MTKRPHGFEVYLAGDGWRWRRYVRGQITERSPRSYMERRHCVRNARRAGYVPEFSEAETKEIARQFLLGVSFLGVARSRGLTEWEVEAAVRGAMA